MATIRALTFQNGNFTNVRNGDSLIVGSGITTATGGITIASTTGAVTIGAIAALTHLLGNAQIDGTSEFRDKVTINAQSAGVGPLFDINPSVGSTLIRFTDNNTQVVRSAVPNGANAIAVTVDTSNDLANATATLLSVQNLGIQLYNFRKTSLALRKEINWSFAIDASTTAVTAGGNFSITTGNGNGAAGGTLNLNTGTGTAQGPVNVGGALVTVTSSVADGVAAEAVVINTSNAFTTAGNAFLKFKSASVNVGGIGTNGGGVYRVWGSTVAGTVLSGWTTDLTVNVNGGFINADFKPLSDNALAIGGTGARWSNVWGVNYNSEATTMKFTETSVDGAGKIGFDFFSNISTATAGATLFRVRDQNGTWWDTRLGTAARNTTFYGALGASLGPLGVAMTAAGNGTGINFDAVPGGGSKWAIISSGSTDTTPGSLYIYDSTASPGAIRYQFDPSGNFIPGIDGIQSVGSTTKYILADWVRLHATKRGGNLSSTGVNVTITPTDGVHHVTGVGSIITIAVPIAGWVGSIVLIPDGAFTTVTGDNIALGTAAVVGKAIIMTYDGTNWYPSY